MIEGILIKKDQGLCAESSFFMNVSYHSNYNNLRHRLKSMPSFVNYDEWQRRKNWDTKKSKAMRVKRLHVIALSGTMHSTDSPKRSVMKT